MGQVRDQVKVGVVHSCIMVVGVALVAITSPLVHMGPALVIAMVTETLFLQLLGVGVMLIAT